MENKLVLYIDSNFASPYAMCAYVALKEKRLPFVLKPVDLAAKQHHDAAYEKLSLTAKVPALVHGDFALTEPMQILYWVPVVGTWAQLIFGYCTMARCVSLLPWNRDERFSAGLLKKIFLSCPVRGNILHGLPPLR